MSRRVAGLGSLLLAGLLLGSLALAAPATGQQSDRLQVKLRDSEAAAGRLKVTVAMSGPAWTGERLDQGDFTATIDGQPVHALFLVVSPSVPSHLRILGQLAFVLRDPELRRLLRSRASADWILARIREVERLTTGAHPTIPKPDR